MNKSDKLNIDEVMCLRMAGISTPQILETDVNRFDRLYAANEDDYEELIEQANSILDRQERIGIVSLSCQDDDFPARLRAIGADCPAVIHCLGNLSLLNRESAVAVIGARAADAEGLRAAYSVAERYARSGHVIVSGLAIGCDTAAHRAALSEAVILAQCPAKSGSLHTMRFASKYHKQRYAIAFPRTTPSNQGNHNLLQNNPETVLSLSVNDLSN